MRKTFLYLLYILVAVSAFSCRKSVLPGSPGEPEPTPSVPAPPPPVVKLEETLPPVLSPRMDSISDNIRGYYQSLPARYAESKETYPVIIDFHGGGQFGNGRTELYKVLWFGIPKLISEKKFPASFTVNEEKFSFIVIAPQLARKVANVEILNLLKYVKANFRVDTSRIYLTGFSLGGRQAANYAAQRPEPFAAMVTFGGLPQIDQDLTTKAQSLVDADMPIWHFHNRDDEAWAYSEAVEYINRLNSLAPSIKPLFTTFDVGEGKSHHDCWTRSTNPEYRENGKSIYEWMLGYSR